MPKAFLKAGDESATVSEIKQLVIPEGNEKIQTSAIPGRFSVYPDSIRCTHSEIANE